MKNLKIYIAGAMSGHPNLNWDAFDNKQKQLEAKVLAGNGLLPETWALRGIMKSLVKTTKESLEYDDKMA